MSKFDEITKMRIKELAERKNRVDRVRMSPDEFEYIQGEREEFYDNPMSEEDLREREEMLWMESDEYYRQQEEKEREEQELYDKIMDDYYLNPDI